MTSSAMSFSLLKESEAGDVHRKATALQSTSYCDEFVDRGRETGIHVKGPLFGGLLFTWIANGEPSDSSVAGSSMKTVP